MPGASPDEKTVADGLKEALRVGTDRAVSTTSKTDGFLGNALIRIALPEQFNTMAKTLRSVGLGSRVDSLDLAMNRAAGEATPLSPWRFLYAGLHGDRGCPPCRPGSRHPFIQKPFTPDIPARKVRELLDP